MTETRLTKSGRPRMGTSIEVQLDTGEWEAVKVVGYGTGKDGHTTVMLAIEFADGERLLLHYPDLCRNKWWRPIGGQNGG